MNVIEKNITLKDGRVITLETGKLAKQADGAVMLKMGNTMLLATVVSAQEAGPDVDFMPLSVDYKEKFSAMGRFPGGFTRREGRASDYEILVSRLIDRALRPLFPDDYHAETFVQVTLYSGDAESMPDCLAGLAASAAIAVSDIPFHGPISEVRVARVNGELMINPTKSQLATADLDIMVAATYENIMMVEGEMNEVSEKEMLDAIKFAHEAIKEHCLVQMELAKAVNKEKRVYCHEVNDEELRKDIWAKCYDKAYAMARQCNADKHLRERLFTQVKDEYLESLPEEEREAKKTLVSRYYHDVEKEAVRRMIWMDVQPIKSARSGVKSVPFPDLTVLLSLPAEKRKPWPRSLWVPSWMRRLWMKLPSKEKRNSYYTIISRRSQREKQRLPAV